MTIDGYATRLGQYEAVAVVGKPSLALIPRALPPAPTIDVLALQEPLLRAQLALGRLDGLMSALPDAEVLRAMFVRKEAVLSSQIAGARVSMLDLFLYDIGELPDASRHHASAAARHVAAFARGFELLRGWLPLSLRLIRETHAAFFLSQRDAAKRPGSFRTSDDWIDGLPSSGTVYLPPRQERVLPCLSAWEQFMHTASPGMPALVKIAILIAQFDAIRPFRDGNARMARTILAFFLCAEKILQTSVLCYSTFLARNYDDYISCLQAVRERGEWERWLDFFFNGLADSADATASMASRISTIFADDQHQDRFPNQQKYLAGKILQFIKTQPVFSIVQLINESNDCEQHLYKITDRLIDQGVLRVIRSSRGSKLFCYGRYIDILSEGGSSLCTERGIL
jgi:Fic family protein